MDEGRTKLRKVIISSLSDFLPFPKSFLFKIFKRGEIAKVAKDEKTVHLKDLLKYPAERPKIWFSPKEDIALIQYTGGTTGLPIGVMLTHHNVVSNVDQARTFASPAFPLGELKGVVAVLPFFHIYGMTAMMHLSTLDPSTMVLFPRADLKQIIKAIHRYKPGYFPSITTLHSMLLERKDIKKYNLSSVKVSVLAAMAVPKKLVEDVKKIMEGVVMEGYGLTEASPVTHVNPLHAPRLGSMGIPIIDTDAKVVGPNGKGVGIGEAGELVIKGAQVMEGYWNKPEETSRVLKNGWLFTGDIVRMDEDGYFYFVEREKDLIKYKGYSIFPTEIEDILNKHPAVSLRAIVGIKEEKLGEIPKAYIVLKDEYKGKVSEREIIKFCEERVAPYKKIREVEFRDDLPKSLIGKVLKRELRKTGS